MGLKRARCNRETNAEHCSLQSKCGVVEGSLKVKVRMYVLSRNQSKNSDQLQVNQWYVTVKCGSKPQPFNFFFLLPLNMPCPVAAFQYLLDQSPYNCHATMKHDTIMVDWYKQCRLRYAINHCYGTMHQCYQMDTEDCIVTDMVILQGVQHGWMWYTHPSQ